MKIDLREGRGYRPGIHPHNQPLNYGTRVSGMIPSGGAFTPMCDFSKESPIARQPDMLTLQRIRRRTGTYEIFQLPDYSYAPSAEIDDQMERIYYGNGNALRQSYVQASLTDDLVSPGVLQPIPNDFKASPKPPVPNAPAGAVLGGPDVGNDTTIFVVTWVSDRGEESAPSQGSRRYGYEDGAAINSWDLALPPSIRDPVEARVYMEYEGSLVLLHRLMLFSINTTFISDLGGYFIYRFTRDIDGDPLLIDPDRLDDPLIKQPLKTLNAVDAPTTLHNIVSSVGALMFGVSGDRRTVHVSDVGNPLSYPRELLQRHRVELIMPSYNQIVVLTDGHPSVILGTDPYNVYQIDIPFDEALVSRRGAVDMGHGVAYPSANGICFIAGQSAEIMTQDNRLDGGIQIINPKDWGPYDTSNYVAGRYQGLYVWYVKTGANSWQGHALNLKHMEMYDLPGIQAQDLHPLHIDETGELYFYADDGTNLTPYRMQGSNNRVRASWILDLEMIDGDPFSCARVTADTYNDINLVVDGNRVRVRNDEILRLPSSHRKRRVEIGAEFSDVILRMQFAHQVSELD